METESDPISEYKSSLNDLSFNSKPLINMLTMLAEDYKETKAPEIVRCVEQRLRSVSTDKKLPVLYLLDSICKNVGNIYIKLFTQDIVSTFCHVFEKVDEKTRLSLYKLRQTWSSIFPTKKLYAIDTRIHTQLDPAWPITAPKPENSQKANVQSVVKPTISKPVHQQQVHINPKFLNDAKQVSTLTLQPSGDELAKKLIEKQNELLLLQKQKLEMELTNEKRRLAEQARALQEKELKLKQKEHQMLRSNSPNSKKNSKKRKRSRSHRSPSPVRQRSKSPTHHWNRSPTDRTRQSPNTNNRQQSPSYPMRQTNSYSPHNKSPNVLKNQFISQQKNNQKAPIQPSPTHSSALLPTPIPGAAGQPPVPTTIPAPNILVQPEMLNVSTMSMGRMDQNVGTTMSSTRPITSGVSQMNPHIVNSGNIDMWGHDRDYRKEFDSMINEAHEKLRTGAISSADHDLLVREVERQLRDSQNNSNLINNNISDAPVAEPQDTFSMLVDGKLRKLFYLDDTTAVVLLNAPQNAKFDQLIKIDPKLLDPRRISFEGKPTKVFIDIEKGCNDFVYLDFNGHEKTFFNGDNPVGQRVKFGGPAKEIILNGQSYPAKFGGPPITVWLDGDSSTPHSLKLDVPTPRVKLSDERRLDLWDNIIQKATSEAKPVISSTNSFPVPQKPADVNSLLSKLIAAGVISSGNSQTSAKEEQKKEEKSTVTVTDPPLKLTSDSLKIRRPNVIATLYNGIQCTNCSLRFDDKDHPFLGDKTRYSKHLDWHFRQNRRDKAKPNSSTTSMRRNWYYPLSLWCQFKEVTDEEDTTNLFSEKEEQSENEEEIPLATVIAEKDESLNCCVVCSERFDQQWHEEEEEWRLKNAVKHNEKIYHPLCLADFIAQNDRLEEVNNYSETNESINTDNKHSSLGESVKAEHSDSMSDNKTVLSVLSGNDLNEDSAKESSKDHSFDIQSFHDIESKDHSSVEENETQNNCDVNESLSCDDAKIEVFKMFEIPLNDIESKPNLSDNLECQRVTAVANNTQSDNGNEIQNRALQKDKIVVQQGGIVIKMKASNLPQQPSSQPTEDVEVTQAVQSETIVKGHEMSSLCNIM